MKRIYSIILILSMLSTYVVSAEAEKNSILGDAMLQKHEGLYLITASATGFRTGSYLIDLGASHSLIAPDIILDSSMLMIDSISDMNPVSFHGFGGGEISVSGKVTTPSMKAGTIQLENTEFWIIENLPKIGDRKLSGIIGLDILGRASRLKFMNNNTRRKYHLVFDKSDSTDNQVENPTGKFRLHNGFIVIDGQLNLTDMNFILDSGSRRTLIPPSMADAAYLFTDSTYMIIYRGLDNSECQTVPGFALKLNLGPNKMEEVQVLVGNLPGLKKFNPRSRPGIIGTDILSAFSIIELDFKNNTFRFTP